jgi:competence protein ComEC
VNELPVEKEKTIKFILKVNAVKVKEQFLPSSGEVIAYLRKSKKVNELKAGDDLLLQTKLVEPDPPMNPFEFNYKRSLELKHIQHICFADSNSFERIVDSRRISSIWYFGLKVKEYVLSVLHSSDLSPVSIAVCSALLTGYDEEIDRELMNAFSHSGTLHVLSVSGLHVGLFYFLFSFLFGFVDRKKRFPLLQFIFVTTGLWMLALITGFSAPIVRAVLMFNLFGVGKIFFTGNPNAKQHIGYAILGCIFGFGAQAIVDFIAQTVR